MEILRERLGALIDKGAVGDETREIAAEALEELAVAVEEIQAQNSELAASRMLLEAERERYRTLFHTVPDGFVITTIEGVVTEANQTAADLLGRPRGQLAGRPLSRYVHGDDRRSFYHHLSQLRSAATGTSITINLALDDHVAFPANLRATVVSTAAGGGREIRWLIHDRRGEIATRELRVSEERLRALFETAKVGIVLCEADGSIRFSNRYADQLLERRDDQTDLEQWVAAVREDDRGVLEEMVASVDQAADALSIRYRVTNGQDAGRWVDHTITPLRGLADEIEGSVSTLIDSTAEVEAALELRRSRDFADVLLDTAGALVLVIDRDARIVRFNKACERISGSTSSEAIGRQVIEFLVPPEQRTSVGGVARDMLSTPSPRSLENDWLTKDGRRVRISWNNNVVVDDNGEALAVVCTGVDVTRQRLLEARLAQTDRLESVGRLAAGIAHDFNNTLAVLRLRIERLSTADPAQRDNVEALTRTIEHSKTTIGDLLSFSRHQELVSVPTDVNTELRRQLETLHDLLGGDVELTTDLTDDDSTTVLDPARFEQIIVNLVVNARDAMPDGGVLTVRTAVVDIDQAAENPGGSARTSPAMLPGGCYLCVSVIDTGVGIAPGDLSHVFDPYFTTKPPGRGTGLGLATTYGTVTQFGGEIVVESESGVGTTFTLWLPRYRPDTERPTDPGRSRVAAGSATVLLVDDDDDLREVLADELALLGLDAIEAGDGVAGLELIEQPIDLLVTDIQMPGLDGVALAQAFTDGSPAAPVLFVTGLTPMELRDCLPPGARVLRKPFGAAEFRTAVTELLDLHA